MPAPRTAAAAAAAAADAECVFVFVFVFVGEEEFGEEEVGFEEGFESECTAALAPKRTRRDCNSCCAAVLGPPVPLPLPLPPLLL